MAAQPLEEKIKYEGYDSEEVIQPIPYTNRKYYASTFGKVYELNDSTNINPKKYKEVAPVSLNTILLDLAESFCVGKEWAYINERTGKCVCNIDELIYATFHPHKFETCSVISRDPQGKRRHYLENLIDVNRKVYNNESDFSDKELDKFICDAAFEVEDYRQDMKDWVAERDYQEGEERKLENFLEELKVRRSSVYSIFESKGSYMRPEWKSFDLSLKIAVEDKLIRYVRKRYHYFEREYAFVVILGNRLKVMRNGDIYHGPDIMQVHTNPIVGDYINVCKGDLPSMLPIPVDVIVMTAFNDKYNFRDYDSCGGSWLIYHIDGDRHNNKVDNLITKEDLWKVEDAASDVLVADPALYQACLDIQIKVAEEDLEHFKNNKKKLSNPKLIQKHLLDSIIKLTYYLEIRYQMHKDELE